MLFASFDSSSPHKQYLQSIAMTGLQSQDTSDHYCPQSPNALEHLNVCSWLWSAGAEHITERLGRTHSCLVLEMVGFSLQWPT